MSRRQNQFFTFILEDVYGFVIAFWYFANIMVDNTQLDSLPLLNQGIYHTGRVAFILLVCITVARVIRDSSYKRIRLYVVLIIGIISSLSGAHKWMLELAILVIGLRGTDCDKILRSAYTGLVAGCVIIILLGASGVISGNTVTRSGIVRLSLGFYHPNILGMRFFQIIAMHLYFQSKKGLRFFDAALAILMGLFIHLTANSRTSTFLMFVLGAAAFAFAMNRKKGAANAVLTAGVIKSVLKWMTMTSFLIPLFAIFGSLTLGKLPQAVGNATTLWSRFGQSRLYFDYYGLSWHGRALMNKDSANASYNMFTLDNGYMYLLLGFGVLAFSVFVIGELLLVFRAYRSEKWMLLIILILYLLFGMLETSLIRPHCNFFLLLLSEVLWEGSSIKDLNKKEKNLEYIADRT